MAQGDLILKVDYDITKAESKQKKLDDDFDNSQKSADNIAKGIERTKKELAESAQRAKELERALTESADKLDRFEHGKSAMSKRSFDEELKRNEQIQKSLQKEDTLQAKKQAELDKQNLALEKQNAKTRSIAENIRLNLMNIENMKNPQKETAKFAENMKDSFKNSVKHLKAMNKRILNLAKRVLFFSVITKSLRKMREEIGNILNTDGAFASYTAKIKGNMNTITQTLLTEFKPVIESILWAVERLTHLIALVLAKGLNKDVKQMGKMAKSAKGVEKSAKNALASFDTLQKIDTSSGGGEQGADYSSNELADITEQNLNRIMTLASAAALAVGCILAFSGVNIPLGLALMVLGAAGLVKQARIVKGQAEAEVDRTLASILGIVSFALIAVGLALLAFGNIPFGIGAIVAGIALFVTAFMPIYNKAPNEVKKQLDTIMGYVAPFILVLGLILIATGHLPLGIGALILGVAMIANAVFTDFNKVPEETKVMLAKIFATAGLGLLAIGIILLFCPVSMALAIACIILGVASIVAAVAMSSSFAPEKTKEILRKIFGIVGTALLVIGVILLFCPVSLPIAIACIIIGVAGIVSAVALSNNSMSEKTRTILRRVFSIASGALLAIGVILLFCPVSFPIALACIISGLVGIVSSVGLNKNFVVNWFDDTIRKIKSKFKTFLNFVIRNLNRIGFTVPNWVPGLGGKRAGFNIPYLAKGAVIPGGSPHLAVVGDQPMGQTNIETPLKTMIDAFKIAFAETGGNNITIKFDGNLSQLARILNPVIEEEKKRATAW